MGVRDTSVDARPILADLAPRSPTPSPSPPGRGMRCAKPQFNQP